MKKLLLQLGTSLLTIILPITAMVSCSQTEQTTSKVELGISAKSGTISLDLVDIGGEAFKEKATLDKLFDGITIDNIKKIIVSISFIGGDANLATATNGKIKLTAMEGFTFNGKPFIESMEFAINRPLDLKITRKAGKLTLKAADLSVNNINSIETLSKLFDGIKVGDNEKFNVEYVGQDINYDIVGEILLTGKNGVTINGALKLYSTEFKIDRTIDLQIKAKTTIVQLTPENLVDIFNIEILEKLFEGSGFNSTTLNYLIPTITYIDGTSETATKGLITLTVDREGYTINGGRTINSNEFTILRV